jgi:hypothetical protein
MISTFERDGIRFRYPESWTLETEDTESGWTATVQSPGTAFFVVSLDADMPGAEEMADTALEAMREEYPELEADLCTDERVAGQAAIGHDMRFFEGHLTNTCWTRCLYSPNGTLLVMWQANDLDLRQDEAVLRAICASVQVDEE